MSIYSNVTEQDLNILRKLVEQQKKQRAPKFKNKILKETHDKILSESLSPITKRLNIINKSTKKNKKKLLENQILKRNIFKS